MRWLRSLGPFAIVVQLTTVASAETPATSEPPVGQLDGVPVVAGAVVEVPPRAVRHLVLAVSGAQITLHPGSAVVLASAQWYPPENGSKTIRGSRVFLRNGEVSVRMPKDGAKPSAVSVVLGSGQQSVLLWHGAARIVAHDGDMSVAVDDGAAYVSSQDQWIRMGSGAAALLPKKAPPRLYKHRLATPALSSCGDGDVGIAFDADKRPVRVCWSAVAGAGSYRIEVATDEAMSQIIESFDTPSTTLAAEPRLTHGAYWVRVLATGGADAFPSAPSAPRAIRVLGATLPPGAFVAGDGLLVMPAQASLTVDAPGLTFASGGGNDLGSALAGALAATFVAAPPNGSMGFKLGGHRARVVRLRDPSGAEARLSFVGRELRARVKMTPAHPRWPKDPIDAVVELEDPSKRIDVALEPVTIEVAVDSRPVPATWKRSGDTFRARIAPVDGPGPFFVRVVVQDRAGTEVGRYVLDIDGRRPLDLETTSKERRAR
jgi:hypothetical protein